MNIKEVYKWAYSLEKDYKLLKEQINTSQTSRLIAENNRLNEICIYWEKQYNELKQENEKLKENIDNLKQDLQNRCDRCVELYNKNEHLKQQNTQIKEQNTKLKHKNNQQAKTIDRLIKIITDTDYI